MKRYFWLIIFCIFLVGCSPDITGRWIDPNGLTEITFKEDKVEFFGVEGTYDVSSKKIVMTLGATILEYEYELEDEELILYLDDGELILKKE